MFRWRPRLALWAIAWNFVPPLGRFVGGTPFVVLAFAQSPLRGVIAAAAFITYQNIENHMIQPIVIGRSIDLPPWLALLSAAAGGAISGLLGAVLAVPLVGAAKVMYAEWRTGEQWTRPAPRSARRRITPRGAHSKMPRLQRRSARVAADHRRAGPRV